MSNIWFTSDSHFCHKNIIQYSNRPFSSVEEMNEAMIANWNKVVDKNDTVYHLGDFGFAKRDILLNIFNRLNGNKHLVEGNHDSDAVKLPWASKHDMYELKYKEKYYQLCHYPMRTWNKAFHGARSLFGHVHGTLKPFGFSCDVGVDCWNFTPVNIDTLEELFTNLPRYNGDDHAMPEGKIWQGRDCMLSFKNSFFGDGKYDNVDPDVVANKDPNEFT